MEDYYLFSSGKLERKDNTIRLTRPDGKYKDLKIEVTRDIYLFGEVNLNSKCLNYLAQNKIPVHFFNYYGFYTGSFYPKEQNISGTLLIQQVEAYKDAERRLYYAKKFVLGASQNLLRNLKYYQRKGKNLQDFIQQIDTLVKKINHTTTVNDLMGIEGMIHRIYYSSWQNIFNKDVDFSKRVRRPPDNMVNTLISFLNTLMYTTCLSEIYVTQLNPTISYLHSTTDRRFSLCLDVSEVFKPLIVDRLIFALINKGIVSENDFDKKSNFCFLKSNTKQKIVREYDSYLKKKIRHRTLHREVSYRHLIRLECYKLIKSLVEGEAYEPFKIWW